MLKQNTFRLTLGPVKGETVAEYNYRRGDFKKTLKGNGLSRSIPPEKLLGDLLRRQCRAIVLAVSECQPAALPANLARLDDWRDTVEFHLRHSLAETAEATLSGQQLLYPATLADWLAVADLTRKQHRAPAFLSDREDALLKITGRLDLLAGLILRDKELTEFLTADERNGGDCV